MTSRRHEPGRLRARDVQIFHICDDLTEIVIYFMVVFSPWAFGTTQPWSIWTMNISGYILGVFLVIRLLFRRAKGYVPPTWNGGHSDCQLVTGEARGVHVAWVRAALVLLTVLLLVYCLISAVNARATYRGEAFGFDYHVYIRWLPHSFDSERSWSSFWNYLALALSFWAIVDWLPGKSAGEERATRQKTSQIIRSSASLYPTRLKRLLWVLSINGGLLGLEGIVQRLEGSGRLLFLIQPVINPEAESQFGPYHYRANAAAYLDLAWPVCLGFWWTLHRGHGFKNHRYHLLLLSAVIMAACPVISSSRGGALISTGILILAAVLLLVMPLFTAHRRRLGKTIFLLGLFVVGTLALGFGLGWKALWPRLRQLEEGLTLREGIYATARPMAQDYPLFGTGPGSFDRLFQLYRSSPEAYWPAQLHNDWLETRITFGWLGSSLIALAFVTLLLRWFMGGRGLHGGRRFMVLMWLALAGCLIHARFDFPFQIYSILFLFLILCAIAFSLSRQS